MNGDPEKLAIEHADGYGRMRYQAALSDGRREYDGGWYTPDQVRQITTDYGDLKPRLRRSLESTRRAAERRLVEDHVADVSRIVPTGREIKL